MNGVRRLDPDRLGDHVDRLYRAAWALCGSAHDAEDLVQATYARVLARPRFLHSDDDVGYLLRALRNEFLRGREAARRRPEPEPLPDDPDVLPDVAGIPPDEAVVARQVYAEIAALPPDFRDVVTAVDVLGLTYREAANALKVPHGTVMSRLSRARARLAERLPR